MEAKEERYEFSFTEQINGGGKEELKGLAIDVLPKGDEVDEMMSTKKPQIIFMSEDKGDGKEHVPLGYIEFEDIENLELAQMGLELIQQAIGRDLEFKE